MSETENRISKHEVLVYLALKESPGTWMSSSGIADAAGVSGRSARKHLPRLTEAGIAEEARLFPKFKYRLASVIAADSPAARRSSELMDAASALGLSKP